MNDEREMVLRMLKEGKISVEEADALLQELTEQPAQEEYSLRGVLNAPGAIVRLHTTSGDVELRGR